jgi:hypothetical protein
MLAAAETKCTPAGDGSAAALLYGRRQREALPIVHAPVQVEVGTIPHAWLVCWVQHHLTCHRMVKLRELRSFVCGYQAWSEPMPDLTSLISSYNVYDCCICLLGCQAHTMLAEMGLCENRSTSAL